MYFNCQYNIFQLRCVFKIACIAQSNQDRFQNLVSIVCQKVQRKSSTNTTGQKKKLLYTHYHCNANTFCTQNILAQAHL